jgi:hypothetical protein
MASNYTGLGVQLMTTGEKAGTWGTLTNTNWNIIEQISGGYTVQTLNAAGSGANTTTLAVSDGSAGATLANKVIILGAESAQAITGNKIVTIPLDVEQFYLIQNNTTGAYTVQFKYVSGSDSGFTWATDDKGWKILYASASDATNPVLADTGFGTGDVTLTGTQTLTNKTLTAPKIVDGGFIADGGGDENLVFGEVGTPVNEFKITNAATGSGPILSAISTSATDSNIDINVTPLGTGNVNLLADTVQCGDLNAAVTVTSNGTGDLILNTNNGTASGNITITDAADGDITFTNNGSGNVVFNDAAYNPETGLTDAATITWDAQAMPVTKVTLTDNRILAAPSNGAAGQFISLLIIQDATGSRTLTWNAVFEFPSETAPTLTTTGALADLFVFRYHNSKWLQVGSTLALTVA